MWAVFFLFGVCVHVKHLECKMSGVDHDEKEHTDSQYALCIGGSLYVPTPNVASRPCNTLMDCNQRSSNAITYNAINSTTNRMRASAPQT